MEHNALESSIVAYIISAELGYKMGVSNAAFLLERYHKRMTNFEYSNILNVLEINNYLNLTAAYWIRAANMGIPDARLKQGDIYYYGKGIKQDKKKAFAAYMLAVDLEKSSMAMWNLGYMYEFGIGVKRDFHLAKRWYDDSASNFKQGILASTLSVVRLAVSYYTAMFFGEDVGKGPLFMAPTPKNGGKNQDVDTDSGLVSEKKNEYAVFENKEYDGNANFNQDVKYGARKQNTGLKSKLFLSDFHIIVALCLLLGYLVIIRRRRVPQQPNAQEPTPRHPTTQPLDLQQHNPNQANLQGSNSQQPNTQQINSQQHNSQQSTQQIHPKPSDHGITSLAQNLN
ncbi:hypothetical protein BB561_006246 [Smittium simulii]|uniref:Uncharacterized protein n=1 Tax=Smittium simulii TaxID=133385 RepID=A0A2T9Y5P8_9FUNG|nr:hypothetical protein BB561_006246 [Smittium simulii]